MNEVCFLATRKGPGRELPLGRRKGREREGRGKKKNENVGGRGKSGYLHTTNGQMTSFVLPPMLADVERLPDTGSRTGPPTALFFSACVFKMAEVHTVLKGVGRFTPDLFIANDDEPSSSTDGIIRTFPHRDPGMKEEDPGRNTSGFA